MSGSRTVSVSGLATGARAHAPSQRVGDADRDQVAQRLAEATADGLLQFDEMDERLSRLFAARTVGELAALTADLPEEWLQERQRTAQAGRRAVEARRGLAVHARWYLLVMTGLVAVWATVGLTAHSWYPWPMWPALGWGFGLVSHARAAYGTPSGARWSAASGARGWACGGRARGPAASG